MVPRHTNSDTLKIHTSTVYLLITMCTFIGIEPRLNDLAVFLKKVVIPAMVAQGTYQERRIRVFSVVIGVDALESCIGGDDRSDFDMYHNTC